MISSVAINPVDMPEDPSPSSSATLSQQQLTPIPNFVSMSSIDIANTLFLEKGILQKTVPWIRDQLHPESLGHVVNRCLKRLVDEKHLPASITSKGISQEMKENLLKTSLKRNGIERLDMLIQDEVKKVKLEKRIVDLTFSSSTASPAETAIAPARSRSKAGGPRIEGTFAQSEYSNVCRVLHITTEANALQVLEAIFSNGHSNDEARLELDDPSSDVKAKWALLASDYMNTTRFSPMSLIPSIHVDILRSSALLRSINPSLPPTKAWTGDQIR
jgi:hypothetical protein